MGGLYINFAFKMIIRNGKKSDIETISKVTTSAFQNHPISNHTEQFIINALRAENALTISLVTEIDGRVVGHIAFSHVTVSDGATGWYGLGPVSVLPEYQKQGIGKSLINEGLSLLKEMGGQGCALVGDPSHNTSGKAGGLKNVNRSKRLKNHDPPKGGLYSNSFS